MIRKSQMTVTSLARALGVSITTVSFVLNGRAKEYGISAKTEAKVLRGAKGMGYVPNALARMFRQNRSGVIGVVFPHLRNDWAHHIMSGAYGLLEKAGYIPFIINHEENPEQERRQIDSLIERRVDAFLINPIARDVGPYKRIIHLGIPLVFFSDALKALPEVPYAAWDPAETSIAVRHLIEIGRKKIAYLGIQDVRPVALRRLEVFKETLRKAGRSVKSEHILLVPPGVPMQASVKKMFAEARHRPDALFGVYDDCAMTAIDVLSGMNLRVPQDVAVATLGDSRAAGPQCYDLTTVGAPIVEEGRKATQLILNMLRDPAKTQKPVMVQGGRLVKRGSTRV